jgi:putative oxidoreductase
MKKQEDLFESLNLKPGKFWVAGAGASEVGGGTLTSLGFLHPIGPLATMAGMMMGTRIAHWRKPIWVNKGGGELPVFYMITALSMIISGPGKFSLDRLLGVKVPRSLVALTAIAEAGLTAYAFSLLAQKEQASKKQSEAATQEG